ncbi:Deacetylases, including yeast histone deacetylase and acetoin utilization protein [[Clostridium] ultunense Esp]|uniref:Deacetylases, including yeast histone deacetylase and acetoin utilization protein n=1 Tax=[Clostridium] ultunense Esp TaxID=1288971 RepID=M1ZG64_9FIRM|nr:histone deacetylase [Schnuerera ultunensis]CCQ92727.1 Deacetylases, including yeast histone deacetylase and acetoin utilization protein [[Clostridium] ultunense Esp]SHD77845.1 Deacetylases, including yeast histone deacetylase and acetoin utilization protein [[Clostridium] ultunense Esp]
MIKAKNRLGLVFFPAFDWAISPTHPEREERLLYTQDQIFEEGIEDIEGIKFYNPIIAEEKDIERVHFPVPDVKSRVTQSHLISVGGAIIAFQAIMKKEVDKSFALVRPPGHHAHRVVYGDRGFCVVNVEAVMLERIRQEYEDLRVAIVDTDCHHGDGTQDIYWNDKDTLFISFHQDGRTLYPGTGFIEEFGGPAAYGYNVNIPLPPGTGEEGFLYVLDNVVIPILDEYKPDIIINSAGQDNHYTDPITNMNFTAQGYAKLNDRLNPDIAVLEGGYSIEGALPYINLGIILAMAGIDYSKVHEPDYNKEKLKQPKDITEYIKQISELVYKRWKIKDDLRLKEFKGYNYVDRERQIYYDTDGILENQVQRFKVCKKCSGVNTIDSSSDRGYHIFAITIPRDACSKCIDEGYKLYKNTSTYYSNVYLQDRVNDKYYFK